MAIAAIIEMVSLKKVRATCSIIAIMKIIPAITVLVYQINAVFEMMTEKAIYTAISLTAITVTMHVIIEIILRLMPALPVLH